MNLQTPYIDWPKNTSSTYQRQMTMDKKQAIKLSIKIIVKGILFIVLLIPAFGFLCKLLWLWFMVGFNMV